MNKRMIIITVLLLYLVCFHCVFQAQEEVPWRIISVEISKDGRYLAVKHGARVWVANTSNYDSGVWIYDLENLLLPPKYLSEAHYYDTRMVFSPNSEYLAVGGYYNLMIFNTNNNAVILDLPRSATTMLTDFRWISFSPDSSYIMSFSDAWQMEHEISIWNIHTGQRIHAVDVQRTTEWVERPWLSPDWRQFFNWSPTRTGTDTIYQFDIEQGIGQLLGSISSGEEIAATYSPDSSFFALVLWEGEVQVYETDTWTLKNSISLHQSPCGEGGALLAFAHNNSWLAVSCPWDGTLSVWDYEANELVFRTETFVGSLQFTLDDAFLISSRYSSQHPERFSIRVWNIEKDFELTTYPGVSPQLHPNSELMAAIGSDGNVWIWNIKQDRFLMILPVPQQ